jgi:hypothetical protein
MDKTNNVFRDVKLNESFTNGETNKGMIYYFI